MISTLVFDRMSREVSNVLRVRTTRTRKRVSSRPRSRLDITGCGSSSARKSWHHS